MRIWVALDVTTSDKIRTRDSVTETLEAEIEDHAIEVDHSIYWIKVVGSGRTVRDLHESIKLRSQK